MLWAFGVQCRGLGYKLFKKSSETQVWLTISLLLPTHFPCIWYHWKALLFLFTMMCHLLWLRNLGTCSTPEYGGGCKVKCAKMHCYCHHSNNSQVRFDPEKVPWGQSHGARPIPGSDWSGIRVKMTGIWVQNVFLTRIPGQSDSDSRSVWPGFPGRSDPKMGLAPSDSFPGQIWPGSF